MTKRKYKVVFANEGHQPIARIDDLKFHCGSLGLILDGVLLGTADLRRRSPVTVSTERVALERKYRRKGHGIHLYLALIAAAASIGAERIYSSRYLNSKSKRMWGEKLAEYFHVHRIGGCRHCGRRTGYWINLKENTYR